MFWRLVLAGIVIICGPEAWLYFAMHFSNIIVPYTIFAFVLFSVVITLDYRSNIKIKRTEKAIATLEAYVREMSERRTQRINAYEMEKRNTTA
jgi:hypothetical protein